MRVSILILCFLASLFAHGKFEARLSQDRKTLVIKADKGNSTTALLLPKGFEVDGEPKTYSGSNFHMVLVSVTDQEASGTTIYVYNDGAKFLWKYNLRSFNPSEPLIEDSYVFVAALGMVAKLQKNNGKVIWKHEGLLENLSYEFEGASQITRNGHYVVFEKDVVVDDRNGKLIEVKK